MNSIHEENIQELRIKSQEHCVGGFDALAIRDSDDDDDGTSVVSLYVVFFFVLFFFDLENFTQLFPVFKAIFFPSIIKINGFNSSQIKEITESTADHHVDSLKATGKEMFMHDF